jgi:hypothetical protein
LLDNVRRNAVNDVLREKQNPIKFRLLFRSLVPSIT